MQRSDDASDDALSFVILKKAILQKSEAVDNQIIWWSVTFNFHIYKDQIMLYKFAISTEAILQKSGAGGNQVIWWFVICIYQFAKIRWYFIICNFQRSNFAKIICRWWSKDLRICNVYFSILQRSDDDLQFAIFKEAILQISDDALQFAIFKKAILQKSGAGGNQMICWHPVITQSGSSQPCAVADIKTFKLWKEEFNFALVFCNFQVCNACAAAYTKTF